MLNISEATSLAFHALAVLAREPGRRRSNTELAASLGASEAHLAKVLSRLARAGLVLSSRGRGGGVALTGEASRISLWQVYELLEGPPEVRACLAGPQGGRPCGPDCILGDLLHSVQEQVRDKFEQTYLTDLAAAPLDGLRARAGATA